MESQEYFTISLKSGIRFVATASDGESAIPGMISVRPMFLDRELLLHPTAIEAIAPCSEKEATRTAKSLNGKTNFHRYFGDTPIRLKV